MHFRRNRFFCDETSAVNVFLTLLLFPLAYHCNSGPSMYPGYATILSALTALAGVIGLILLVGRFVRTQPLTRRGAGALAAREILALDQRRRLHLVRCAGREVLLLTGGPQDVVVGWLPDSGAEP